MYDILGSSIVRLHGVEADNHFYKQSPLNNIDNNFNEKFYNGNYKKTINNFHDSGWKNSYFRSTDVAMIGHVHGVSQYPLLYDQK